ncbi:putative ABC transport system permease protein [Motilibacter rhizosphaerae]|uniref:Putative ABC transport system permease protein n=1 Tax=Motilibacter rhizosphaerae TaxID=598652 RepID=A0A4Q7NAT5_9ACTN|nr:FtsX-like permease family protein [Motilibacter rhizosphaerae]RZS80058.1 putative ABC transport system permease protein [Motilibacter rhizosphaerae]
MLNATVKGLLAHKLRLALSAIAVVLGVAFVAGSFVFTDTLRKTFDGIFDQATADVVVQPKAAFETDTFGGGQQPDLTLPAALLPRLRAVPGVAEVNGDVNLDGVRVLDGEGKTVGNAQAPGIGTDWSGGAHSPLKLVTGRVPQHTGEVAIDTTAAKDGHIAVGQRVTLLMPQGPRQQATVVGLMKFGSSGSLAGATITAFDPATAQALLGKGDVYSSFSVWREDGTSDAQLKSAVSAALQGADTGTQKLEVLTHQEAADQQSSDIQTGLSFITTFLLVFAGVALFVGSFIILNTFSMIVAQRTRELALLRALGASRRQVTRSVLLEALVVGLVGSIIGVALGMGLAVGLRALFKALGIDFGTGGLVLAPRTVVVGLLVGVVVTVLASWAPARRAAKVAPVAALRDDQAMGSESLRRRSTIGAVITVLGAAGLAGALATDGSTSGWLLAAGAVGLLVGVIVLSPVIGVPVVRVLGAPFARLRGSVGTLSSRNAQRNPRRTAATASALMIGLALVTGIGVIASSANASVGKLVADALGSQYVVSDPSFAPFSTDVGNQLAKVPGVSGVVRERFGSAQINGKGASVAADDAAGFTDAVHLQVVSGSADALSQGKAIVLTDTAKSHHVGVGSPLRITFPSGQSTTIAVGAVVKANAALQSWTIPLSTWDTLGGAQHDQFLYVSLASGAKDATVRPELDRVMGQYPNLQLQDQKQFGDAQRKSVDQLLALIYGLLGLAIVIAVLGIINTLALSVVERTREIGLLRAVGMSRRQLRRMVRYESVVISVFGAVLGIVLGLVLGLVLLQMVRSSGLSATRVPGVQIVVFLVLAAVVGVLAAVWPARRASRLDVLRAIAAD